MGARTVGETISTDELVERLTGPVAPGDGRWREVFCRDCFGNRMVDGKTTDASGAACGRCGGRGTMWRLLP